MVQSCFDVEWFWFQMAFQIQTASGYSKLVQIGPNSCHLGFLCTGLDNSFSCRYDQNHYNTTPHIWTSKQLDLEWFLNSNVRYSIHQCTKSLSMMACTSSPIPIISVIKCPIFKSPLFLANFGLPLCCYIVRAWFYTIINLMTKYSTS